MSTRYTSAILLVCLFLGFAQTGYAQSDEGVKIYGYFQGTSRYLSLKSNPRPTVDRAWTFSIQQMNLFFFKQFDANFSGFATFEFTNSISTDEGWGSFALEQAWMKYDKSNKFKVKAGLLLPTFNNLNTIKDRTPLLPYILRPFAYESVVRNFLHIGELVPQRAGVEIYGTFDLSGQTKLDYATFLGNIDAHVVSSAVTTLPSGNDSTVTKMVGGRIGIRKGLFKTGVSGAYDVADLSKINFFQVEFDGVGFVDRARIGADLSFNYSSFFFEAEVIKVLYALNASQKDSLQAISSSVAFLNNELDRSFVYAVLGANIGDQFFAYGMYSYFQDGSNLVLDDGFGGYSVGGGYRPNDSLVFKLQLQYASTYSKTIFFGKEWDVFVGLSVFL